MISPSIFFKDSAPLCGEPGAEFARELEAWNRPALVSHPTIRRIDWKRAAASWPGTAPEFPFDGNEAPGSYATELFVWARSAWRGFLAPQLDAVAPWRGAAFDGRECHPFILGYVRGAIWELLEHTSVEESWQLSAFLAIGATADVFGLEWVDDIEDAIDELKGCGLPPPQRLAFQEGARRGIEEMESYLAGAALAQGSLVEWFHGGITEESRPLADTAGASSSSEAANCAGVRMAAGQRTGASIGDCE